jgi:predicted aldo/keto reductase-like oxidoreductase
MQYREYGRTAIKVSPLGFGCMRLPMENDHVKEEYTITMLRHAMDLGVNYFDTGVGYCNQESQVVLGKAIKGRRDKLYISTKNPHKGDDSKEWRRLLEESLERLDIDYIDFYHCHGLSWQQYVEGFSKGPLAEARKAQKEGLFRYLGFSSHDSENIPKLIDTGEFAGMTVQYNLLDRKNEEAIAMAHEKGMGVVIMGPIGGGRLVAGSEQFRNLIPGGGKSSPEVALRFVLSNPNVTIALSGMNSIEMVDENVATASHTEPLSDEEHQHVLEMLEENKRLADLYCTGCGYCMPCENGVDIPENFRLMNYHRIYGLTEMSRGRYGRLGERKVEDKPAPAWAEACIECGKCEPKCPQDIPIREQLKEVRETLGLPLSIAKG